MTLGNMRELGVRSLAVTCVLCHHEAILAADAWPDAVLVRTFAPRMVCTRCGIVGADARAELAGDDGQRELARNPLDPIAFDRAREVRLTLPAGRRTTAPIPLPCGSPSFA